jgi:hypothetical protein
MWKLSATESAHALRSALALRWADPRWVTSCDLTSQIDAELLRLRGRYAKAMPGVEIQ